MFALGALPMAWDFIVTLRPPLPRSTGEFMNRHCRYCDDGFARAENTAAAEDWIGLEQDGRMFLHEMECHIGLEVKRLFPAFGEKQA